MTIRLMGLFAAGALGACGSDSSSSSECVNPTGTNTSQYIVNSFTLPRSSRDAAYDLNGSGAKNQLGNIVAVLSGPPGNFDVQGGVNTALMSGGLNFLIEVKSSDTAFMNDNCAGTSTYIGVKTMAPPMANTTYMKDTTRAPGNFGGKLSAGAYTSNDVPKTTHPVTLALDLQLVAPPVAALPITLVGGHIQYTRNNNGLMNGQLNGAIKSSDVQGTIVPSVAGVLTAIIRNPMSDAALVTALKGLFDNGGMVNVTGNSCAAMNRCTNPPGDATGMCGVPNDGTIQTCEISTNSLIGPLLAGDVQLFDSSGNFRPNKDNTTRDSLSLGVNFTAIPARF